MNWSEISLPALEKVLSTQEAQPLPRDQWPAWVLLDWARRGLTEADGYGLSNAVTYAKLAAACRIDALLQYNHLVPFFRTVFPKKIAALRRVGVGR